MNKTIKAKNTKHCKQVHFLEHIGLQFGCTIHNKEKNGTYVVALIMQSRGFTTQMFNISEALELFQFPKYLAVS